MSIVGGIVPRRKRTVKAEIPHLPLPARRLTKSPGCPGATDVECGGKMFLPLPF